MNKLKDLKQITDVNPSQMDLSDAENVRSNDIKTSKMYSPKKRFKFLMVVILSIAAVSIIAFFTIFNNASTAFASKNLMQGIEKNTVTGNSIDDRFIEATQKFSIELLKQSISTNDRKDINTLISPVSVYLALGMTANGADNETLKQFENVLGDGTIPIEELNRYYYTLQQSMQKNKEVKLNIADSIWFGKEDGFTPKTDFLQINANYYGASAYQNNFNSPKTVNDINSWVEKNTDGLIKKMLDKIDSGAMMYLINTVLFDAEWETQYFENGVEKGDFNLNSNQTVNVDFMYSEEYFHLKDKTAEGFIKPYKGNQYSFAAILPNKGIDINDFIKSLDSDQFIHFLKNKSKKIVDASMPKLKYSYENDLSRSLKNMGIKNAFSSSADFKKMSDYNLFISRVLHKTNIQVDENGTKAGAATMVEMTLGSPSEGKVVRLNRPFVYAIIDNETNLPVFIGTVLNPALS